MAVSNSGSVGRGKDMTKEVYETIEFVDEDGNPIPDLEPLQLTQGQFQTLEAGAAKAGLTLEEFFIKLLRDKLEEDAP
jgi:hypothetical protein